MEMASVKVRNDALGRPNNFGESLILFLAASSSMPVLLQKGWSSLQLYNPGNRITFAP
jgi:hypothetical protein